MGSRDATGSVIHAGPVRKGQALCVRAGWRHVQGQMTAGVLCPVSPNPIYPRVSGPLTLSDTLSCLSQARNRLTTGSSGERGQCVRLRSRRALASSGEVSGQSQGSSSHAEAGHMWLASKGLWLPVRKGLVQHGCVSWACAHARGCPCATEACFSLYGVISG